MVFVKLKLRTQLSQRWQRLYRIAYSWCHDTQLAKDMVQDTILKALKNSHQLDDLEALDAWLFRILINVWRDVCRHAKDHYELLDSDLIHERTPEYEHQQTNTVNRVRRAVAALSREQREIITLIDLEQLSYKEVADIMQIPIGTVMSRICRARRQLKEALVDVHQHNAQVRRIK